MCVQWHNGSCDCDSHSGSQSGGAAVFKLMNRPIPFIARPSRQQKPRESAASVVGSEEVGRQLEGRSAVTTLTSRMKMHFN